MNKRITLEENINKLQNNFNSIFTLKKLVNKHYMCSSYTSVFRRNKQLFNQTIKNTKRLLKVVSKQLNENSSNF